MSHLDEGTLHEMLDGEFSPGKTATLRRHIEQCSLCQGRLAEARALRSESDSLIESLEPSPSLRRVWRPLTSTRPVGAPRLRPPGVKRVAMAGSLVAAVTFGIYLGATRFGPERKLNTLAVNDAHTGTADSMGSAGESSMGARNVDSAPLPTMDQPRAKDAVKRSPPRGAPIRQESKAEVRELASVEKNRMADLAQANAADESDANVVDQALATLATHHAAVPPSPSAAAVASRAKAAARVAESVDDTIKVVKATAEEAKRAFGGNLLNITGFKPAGFEIVGPVVATVYRVQAGTLRLAQWRSSDTTAFKLFVPEETPADTVTAWKSRIR